MSPITQRTAATNPATLDSPHCSIISCFLALALISLIFAPASRAVTPPPDGGYPNNTTAEGEDALFNLTTGTGNTAVGLSLIHI